MASVNLYEVSKRVGSTTILDKVSLSINKGEFMVVVGPSGCGKSTLLRLIAGLEELSSGKILINDQCVNDIPAAKRDMAMVFQQYALYPHMTVFDNMAYGLKMRRFSKVDIYQRVTEAASLLQLTPYLDRKPLALSGGQKQRVAMGRAIVRSPSVFLFDEPLSNLDAKLRTDMRHEIRRLHQQLNTTSLYVTHDQTEAMTMGDRVLVLNQGAVEQIGSSRELYQSPSSEFVAGFTGHYPINFISGTLDKVAGTIQTEVGLEYPVPDFYAPLEQGAELVLAIRPEHIQVCMQPIKFSLKVKVEFVDDMGADKLIHGRCVQSGVPFNVRVNAEHQVAPDYVYVELPKTKLHGFLKETGKRIGDWRE